ncbi:MAG: nucleotidyltransferase domain-containing protein, partial [Gorillibacterium sp.]|nr:nucleotidyltransferase domain-containing protein [Gorillibacterium sp.]
MKGVISVINVLTKENREVSEFVLAKAQELLGDSLHKAILFGSRARGDHNEDSDFDFIFIGDFEQDWVQRITKLRRHIGFFG